MKYLEHEKVIHSDLAARNVLLKNNLTAKIADFGLARSLREDKDYYRWSAKANIPFLW